MSTGLGREDIRALLDDLSAELAARGARAELFLVGGADEDAALDGARAREPDDEDGERRHRVGHVGEDLGGGGARRIACYLPASPLTQELQGFGCPYS